jgi:hypothetical protein
MATGGPAMSEGLIGVVIGGVIGSIVPVVTLMMTQSRWKREIHLAYLKEERARLEKFFSEHYQRLSTSMHQDALAPDLMAECLS